MSSNQFFLIFKEPLLHDKPAPAMFDYFIQKEKPLNLGLIR